MGSLIGESVISLRDECTGHWPVHFFQKMIVVAAAFMLAALPSAATAAAAAPAQRAGVSAQSVDDFYRGRNNYPLWLAPTSGDAAQELLKLLSTSNVDGLDPAKYRVEAIQEAMEAAKSGKRKRVEEADRLLSEAFVAYVADLRQDPGVGITYVDANLKPAAPTPLGALLTATIAPSLGEYVRSMGWMHPIYAQLREALANHGYTTDQQRDTLELNMRRARVLPPGKQRYVLVNAAQQRLYMYE